MSIEKLNQGFGILIPRRHWDKIKILDSDRNIYRFTEEIEHEELNGFFYIPGFERYVINRQGVVIDLRTRKIHDWVIWTDKKKVKKGGYRYRTFRDNSNKKNYLSRHRALAKTFIPYELREPKMIVNHINGIPGDDRLDNLEWVTYSENNKHAYDNNLYREGKTIPVIYRNRFTGETRSFPSIFECMKGINKKETYVRLRVNRPELMFDDGIDIKINDGRDWPVVRISKKVPNYRQITSRNIFTGHIGIYKDSAQAESVLGIKSGTIKFHCDNRVAVAINGFNFRFIGEDFPVHSELSLLIFKKFQSNINRPVYVIEDEDGIVHDVFRRTEDAKSYMSSSSNDDKKLIIRIYDPRKPEEYKLPH